MFWHPIAVHAVAQAQRQLDCSYRAGLDALGVEYQQVIQHRCESIDEDEQVAVTLGSMIVAGYEYRFLCSRFGVECEGHLCGSRIAPRC
jgi:hypothetical protein